MRYLFSLLFLIFALSVNAKEWQLRVSDNNRYLETVDGKPFFWLGDTGWLLPQKLDRNEANGYLARCHENGYNVVQIQVLNGVPSYNFYGQMSNVSKSNPWDFTDINKEGVYGYWDHMDYLIDLAAQRDIYIGMVCIWGGLVKAGLMDVDGAKAYGKFLAERYKNKPNIIWIIGGDIQGNVKPEVWTALAEIIKSIDHNHLMTYHPRGRHTSAQFWPDAKWLDFHMYQSGHRKYGQRMGNKDYPIPDNTEEDCWMYVDSTYAHGPLKPVLDGEPSYEDIPKGLHFPKGERWQAEDVRRYAYWGVFAGACGHTYGHNAIMQMARPGDNVAYADKSKPWYEAQRDPGYVQMQYLKALMLALPYTQRVPDQSLINDNGTQYDRLIATRGEDYALVYNYTSRKMDINIGNISGAKKKVWWMDAATGNLSYLGEFSGKKLSLDAPVTTAPSESHSSASGNIHDGVLIIIDATKSYIASSQTNILVPVVAAKKDLTE